MMLTKKRTLTFCLAAVIALSATACSHPSNGSTSSAGTQGTSSQSSQSEQKKEQQQAKQQVKDQEKANKSDYKYKMEKFGFNKNYKEFHADYPQFAQDGTDFSKVNAQIKNTAMQTINSYGTQKGSEAVDVNLRSTITYHNKNFISILFKETVETIPFKGTALDKSKDKTTSSVRTLNFDLSSGKAVALADLAANNGALVQQLQQSAKKGVKKDVSKALTASAIQSALPKASIYFRDSEVNISLPISQSLGGHVELGIDYPNTSGFRTTNTIWNNFSAKSAVPQSSKK